MSLRRGLVARTTAIEIGSDQASAIGQPMHTATTSGSTASGAGARTAAPKSAAHAPAVSTAARVSEHEADDAATSWGYAAPLTSAYRGLAAHEVEPAGRLGRLMADHPPLAARIERLELSVPAAVSAHP